MNIKDFLIDNYIWIIVIILITIITIIGFLADRKKNGKKNADTSVPTPNNNMNMQQPNNMGQMQYSNQAPLMANQMNNNMNMGMNTDNLNNTMQPTNPTPNYNMPNVPNNNMNQMVQEQPMTTIPTSVDVVNNPTPVENVVPTTTPEPMYQPLSEQKPVIPAQPIPNFGAMQNTQETPIGQTQENTLNQNMSNVVTPQMQPNYGQLSNQQIPQQPMGSETMGTQLPNYNIPTPMPQTMENNNFGGNMPNFNQNNTTVPEPVNPIPVPQPINPQPIMQGTYNNGQMMQSNYGQPSNQSMQHPMSQPVQSPIENQSTQPVTNSPISFVYGPQSNNQNM